MIFNSLDFFGFFGLFLCAYTLCRKSLATRNILILVGSYIFYAWWDYRFLALLVGSSLVDYGVGRALGVAQRLAWRRAWLILSVSLNLGVLFFFKYFGFFRDSLANLLATLGVPVSWSAWEIILPVGISFYTFQSVSYTLDVYRRETAPRRRIVDVLAYVAFFPQLVAGPIERAQHLLPQLETTRAIRTHDIEEGLWLLLWGLFKKIVVADQLAPLVALVYDQPVTGGPLIILGTIAFAVQIYCDFSGYSDIAMGVARMLGFQLMLNFNLPYFAVSVREFWRRWHISLSTWLRDYLYIPLGGGRKSTGRSLLNLMITFLLGGLWHGAAVNFLLWGFWHGVGVALSWWWDQSSPRRLPVWLARLFTLSFVLYGWLLFRARTPLRIAELTTGLVDLTLPIWWADYLLQLVVLTLPVAVMQLWQARTGDLLVAVRGPVWRRALIQAALVLGLVTFWSDTPPPFIYFQF